MSIALVAEYIRKILVVLQVFSVKQPVVKKEKISLNKKPLLRWLLRPSHSLLLRWLNKKPLLSHLKKHIWTTVYWSQHVPETICNVMWTISNRFIQAFVLLVWSFWWSRPIGPCDLCHCREGTVIIRVRSILSIKGADLQKFKSGNVSTSQLSNTILVYFSRADYENITVFSLWFYYWKKALLFGDILQVWLSWVNSSKAVDVISPVYKWQLKINWQFVS